jgi:lambda family phage portal protein
MYSHGQSLLARNRDAVRNSAWASAAVDSYVANAIGNGIRLVPHHPDPDTRALLLSKWTRWIRESDVEYDPRNPASGQTDFHGQQMVIAREVMEGGEVFVRFRPRSKKEGLAVPLQLQLIEAEQLPLWRTSPDASVPVDNRLRAGIEFQPDGRRAAYHFFKAHPGETMFFPMDAFTTERVPATDVLHVYKPIRAGQFRGVPWLTSVLAKLYELEQYTDAEVVKKKLGSMITGFIKQVSPENPIMPVDQFTGGSPEPAVQMSTLEPGTFQVLNFGEEVQFATTTDSGDYVAFVRSCLQAFAVGAGLAEHQVTGDLSQANFSSLRAGLLEFRRKCEQFQHSVFIFQVCHPVYRRWLREGMLALAFGPKLLAEYDTDPEPFEDVQWVTPGWPWVDPQKDQAASREAIRDGVSTRSRECAAQGLDSAIIDEEQASDNERADNLKLSYDSDGRKVLTGKNAGLTEEDITDEMKAARLQVPDPVPPAGKENGQ